MNIVGSEKRFEQQGYSSYVLNFIFDNKIVMSQLRVFHQILHFYFFNKIENLKTYNRNLVAQVSLQSKMFVSILQLKN